ncbi:MAG: S-layer homology domain-containing protein, partial [Acidobacteria bacterium]|nr:S-layer homology domain-containing protein [Acidobacteriota bacterium]
SLPTSATDWFTDDQSIFEEDINAIAEAGITRGCDTTGTRYCPDQSVTRGEMAAFLRRALSLPTSATDWFTDDQSIFEEDINAIAEAGITRGCDTTGTRYCPDQSVTRGEMAAFLRRSLGLPSSIIPIPIGDHPALVCPRAGETCTLTVEVDAGRSYMIKEGVFQVLPGSAAEMVQFTSPRTSFTLAVDGSGLELAALPLSEEGDIAFRRWEKSVSFTAGTHTLVGVWRWDGVQIQTTTVTVRAAG